MAVPEIIGLFFNFFFIFLICSCWICIIVRLVKNKRASVIRVKAIVVDKYKTKSASRMRGLFADEKYTIVFLADDKRMAFNVSEFSYKGYRVSEKGTLKYKGHKIIEFS